MVVTRRPLFYGLCLLIGVLLSGIAGLMHPLLVGDGAAPYRNDAAGPWPKSTWVSNNRVQIVGCAGNGYLDPGEGADILKCAEVAFLLRDTLKQFNLKSFPKVSGSKGIQIHVPLNNALAAADPASHEAASLWARYLTDWTLWNHLRTVRRGRAGDADK